MENPIIVATEHDPICKVEKTWGHEIIIENNELYCGKLLVFSKGKNFSMHYHLKKDETWYIQKGSFCFKWVDLEKAEERVNFLYEGDSVRISPGLPHQLLGMEEENIIFEFSTQHFDEDSYRLYREWKKIPIEIEKI